MTDDADRLVLRPMTSLFPAPTHLRGSHEQLALALGAYRRALSRFSPDALEKGWQAAVEENPIWCWPKLCDLVRACEKFSPRRDTLPAEGWPEKAGTLADQYVSRFMKTSQAARRCDPAPLKVYVRACAWVQAQYLLGRGSVAYESGVLFQRGEDVEERQAFFDRARAEAAKGRICVRVPHGLLAEWKSAGQGQER